MTRLAVAAAGAIVGLVVLLAALLPADGGAARHVPGLRPGTVPASYVPLVVSAGRACPAAPPSILAAQLEAESGWNPVARSPAGALGIAQFMPGTWARWGRDANGDGRADPWDPQDAIPAQAAYDCALAAALEPHRRLGRLRGAITELMLAAYNAGPGAVLLAGGLPAAEETRSYVARVVARAALFDAAPSGSSTAEAGSAAPVSRAPAPRAASPSRSGRRPWRVTGSPPERYRPESQHPAR